MPNRNIRVYIQAYKQASNGAKTLQANLLALNGAVSRVWRRATTDFSDTIIGPAPVKNSMLVNWGVATDDFTRLPEKTGYGILNRTGVKVCQNKRSFFQGYSGIDGLHLPAYWTDVQRAANYVANTNRNGEPVLVERHNLTGHGGAGIRLIKDQLEVRDAPLYTQYIPKASEYRVHFFKHPGMETQYFIQQKRLRRDHEEGNENMYKIRNLANGWVFCHQQIEDNPFVRQQAERFAGVTPLDFGAIDIIYNNRQQKAYVLEVNTAPGLEGETGRWYAKQVELAASRHNFATLPNQYHV